MNNLLKLGLKTQSKTIVQKHLLSNSADSQTVRDIFHYSVENNKLKILELMFECKSINDYPWLSDSNIQTLTSFESSVISKVISQHSACELTNENEEVDSASLGFDWESDDIALTSNIKDHDLKDKLLTQNTVLTTTKIHYEEPSFLEGIEFELPTVSSLKYNCSKFITDHKKELKALFNYLKKYGFNDEIINDKVRLYFIELDNVDELIFAVKLSLNESVIENTLNFNQESNICFIRPSLDVNTWFSYIDMFIEISKKPKLANPVYRNYFLSLGAVQCQPLSGNDELSLVTKIQELLYDLVSYDKENVIDKILNSFSENFESTLINIEDEYQLPTKSREELKRFIEIAIDKNELFLRPLSFIDAFNDCKSQNIKFIKNEVNELIQKFQMANLRLVVNEANKYRHSFLDYYFDLIQDANFGLLSAIDKFNPKKGFKFSTYSTWWIKQSISRYVDQFTSNVRVPVHFNEKLRKVERWCRENNVDNCELTPNNLEKLVHEVDIDRNSIQEMFHRLCWQVHIEENEYGTIELGVDTALENEQYVKFLLSNAGLKEKEHQIILKRFGFIDDTPLTLEEIGDEYGVTRERIRQIEAKALEKISKKAKIILEY